MPAIDSRPTSLRSLRGLTAVEVQKLKRAGIDNNLELLTAAKSRSAELALARKTGISHTRIREAVNRADLVRLDGVGPAQADFFENAGINSVRELAQRNPQSLYKALAAYAAKHPELNYSAPSAHRVKELVAKAEVAVGETPAPVVPTPVKSVAEARKVAEPAMHAYVDDVLFSTHPDGQAFRDAVVNWRSAPEQAVLKQRMHDEISLFFADAELYETDKSYTFVGSWLGLYSEASVKKSGGLERIYVEID